MNLDFVTAEEALKWPTGTNVLCCGSYDCDPERPSWYALTKRPGLIEDFVRLGHDGFARLPEKRPSVTKPPAHAPKLVWCAPGVTPPTDLSQFGD